MVTTTSACNSRKCLNAGFTDVTRLTLRMETKLAETLGDYFSWKPVDEIELSIEVDENGKSSLLCRKNGKLLKSIPSKYKKNETVLEYQEVNKKLKEQYSRTRQMMEQAMEDRTAFEVWEIRDLSGNPVYGDAFLQRCGGGAGRYRYRYCMSVRGRGSR